MSLELGVPQLIILDSLLGSSDQGGTYSRDRITDIKVTIVMSSQFAGGFDAESMAAFEALRNRAQT